MPIRTLQVAGYRSIRRMFLRLGDVNVIIGPNGCGKSNLYRSLYLLHAAAEGHLAQTLAEEGGMPSVLWAGQMRVKESKRVKIAVGFDQWTYRFSCGVPAPDMSAFALDPFVREEELLFHDGSRHVSMAKRENASAQLRNDAGARVSFAFAISDSESILSELREPHRYPELSALRSVLRGWRFYHQFRTDTLSPLRQPRLAVRTPVLSHDGSDLAAALQTILEIGDGEGLNAAIADAFNGAELTIHQLRGGMETGLSMPAFRRPFLGNELSDGTLKYLCLLAALLSPRPPSFLAFNEPDANLHPQLYEPLARMIVRAASHSQLWITTHSQLLAELLHEQANALLIPLRKENGETLLATSGGSDFPSTEWDEDEVE